MRLQQVFLTPAAGKRLLAKATVAHPAVQQAMRSGRLVIIAGTTNGYVAEEVLGALGQAAGFKRDGFRRGLVTPPDFDASTVQQPFSGDVVITDGTWTPGQQIFDVTEQLTTGDVIIKGANAVNLADHEAAVYIGHPAAGSIGAALGVVVGSRVRLLVPVGLEKRVSEPIRELVRLLNDPAAEGPRMMPLPGDVLTELDALSQLTGVTARLVAAGGIYGAEGGVFVALTGSDEQLAAAQALVASVAEEPPCEA